MKKPTWFSLQLTPTRLPSAQGFSHASHKTRNDHSLILQSENNKEVRRFNNIK